jgi:hypothetical protein
MARKPKPSANTPNKSASDPKSSSTSGANLGLGELRVRLNHLEKENEKLLKQIEKNRSELNNISSGIKEIGIEIAKRSAPLVEKLTEIDRKIHDLFEEIVTGRKLGKKTLKDLKSIYYSLQSQGLLSPKVLPGDQELDDDQFPDEEDNEQPDWGDPRQRSQSEDREDTVKLDREELKKIRQLYLQLADIFHPDKVSDPAEKEYCTEVMKEINLAYQTGDLAKLLAIKKKQELNEIIDSDSSDDLARQCARVEAENELLKEQLQNSKLELRKTKKTEAGMILSEFKKLSKHGVDAIGGALEELEDQIKVTDQLCQFVADFRDRKITIKEFLKGPAMPHPNPYANFSEEEMLEMILGL